LNLGVKTVASIGILAVVALFALGRLEKARSESPERLSGGATPATTPHAGTKPRREQRRTFLVERVITGESIKLANGWVISLAGVSAATPDRDCGGNASREELRDVLREGRTRVRLELVGSENAIRRNGRGMAYVYKGRELVNLSVVSRGAATAYYGGDGPNRHEPKLASASRKARARGTGLWESCPATQLDFERPVLTAVPAPPTPAMPTPPLPAVEAPTRTQPETSSNEIPQTPAGNCDPNYGGDCVPPVDDDLDCADIAGPVYVLKDDPHWFDGDGDGVGCEWG
jgi:micrococcal nuclease